MTPGGPMAARSPYGYIRTSFATSASTMYPSTVARMPHSARCTAPSRRAEQLCDYLTGLPLHTGAAPRVRDAARSTRSQPCSRLEPRRCSARAIVFQPPLPEDVQAELLRAYEVLRA